MMMMMVDAHKKLIPKIIGVDVVCTHTYLIGVLSRPFFRRAGTPINFSLRTLWMVGCRRDT